MTDLYDLLNRALDSQPDTPEARLAVYNHIRGLYERRRQEIDPASPEAEVLEERDRLIREQASLETVIARIEAERTGALVPSEEVLSFDRFAADETSSPDGDGVAYPTTGQAAADSSRGRPRVAARREPRTGSSVRRIVAIVAIAAVLGGIGSVAWWLRANDVPAPVEDNQPVAEAPADGDAKISDRVSGAPPDNEPAQSADAAMAAAQPAQPSQSASTDGTENAGQGAGEVLAQRAFLFEVNDQNPEQPNISSGEVVWRLEGKGSPSAVLYADIALPEAGFSFSLVIRPNNDASLPASHTIEVTFINAADKPDRVVQDMAVPQLRIDKEPRGVPLAGLTIPVADNIFLVGLSNLPSDVNRNYNLMRERDWVDLPVRFANGSIGTVTFAKGSAGRQVIAEAVESWR